MLSGWVDPPLSSCCALFLPPLYNLYCFEPSLSGSNLRAETVFTHCLTPSPLTLCLEHIDVKSCLLLAWWNTPFRSWRPGLGQFLQRTVSAWGVRLSSVFSSLCDIQCPCCSLFVYFVYSFTKYKYPLHAQCIGSAHQVFTEWMNVPGIFLGFEDTSGDSLDKILGSSALCSIAFWLYLSALAPSLSLRWQSSWPRLEDVLPVQVEYSNTVLLASWSTHIKFQVLNPA